MILDCATWALSAHTLLTHFIYLTLLISPALSSHRSLNPHLSTYVFPLWFTSRNLQWCNTAIVVRQPTLLVITSSSTSSTHISIRTYTIGMTTHLPVPHSYHSPRIQKFQDVSFPPIISLLAWNLACFSIATSCLHSPTHPPTHPPTNRLMNRPRLIEPSPIPTDNSGLCDRAPDWVTDALTNIYPDGPTDRPTSSRRKAETWKLVWMLVSKQSIERTIRPVNQTEGMKWPCCQMIDSQ